MKKTNLILLAAILSLTALSQTNINKNNGITGSGTANYIPRFSGAKTLTNSVMYQSSGNIGIGLNSTSAKLHVKGATSVGVLSSDYAAKFDNSSNTPLLHIRNDEQLYLLNSIVIRKESGLYPYIHFNTSPSSNNYSIGENSGYLLLNSASNLPILIRRQNTSGSGLTPMLSFGQSNVPNIIQLNQNFGLGVIPETLTLNTDASVINALVQIGTFDGTTTVGKFWFNNWTGNMGVGTSTPTSKLQVVGLVEYADNTAALAAGLTIGAFYRTGDVLKVVH